MPEPISRTQIDRLGGRLRASDTISEPDLRLLQDVRAGYDEALAVVATRLSRELGLHAGTRLKTVGTIVDKLKRESVRLSQMQDIAGGRLVIEGGLDEQDDVVGQVVRLFPGAHVVDRRANPSHGYRAVHVIVSVDRRLIEVQVRTELQDLWAQVVERIADAYGREIRYGAVPNDPTRASVVQALMALANTIAKAEHLDAELARLRKVLQDHRHQAHAGALPEDLEAVANAADRVAASRTELHALLRDGLRALGMRDFNE